MTRTILCGVAMLLAACSNHDRARDATYVAGRPSAESQSLAPGSVAVGPGGAGGARDAHAVPRPSTPRTFGDWSVGCDNTGTCTMESLGDGGTDFPRVAMRITRAAGAKGAYAIGFETPQQGAGATVTPISLTVDGRLVQVIATDGPAAAAIVASVAHAHDIRLAIDTGTLAIPANGAAAALRYIDGAQGRAGGVTAAVAKGDASASAVPPAQAPLTIVATEPRGTPRTPSADERAAMMRIAKCDRDTGGPEPADFAPKSFALGGGRTLVLIPCQVGAYNLSSAMFVIGAGAIAPAHVDAPSGFAATPAGGGATPGIVGGEWKDGMLSGEALGRGLGDCGVRQTFVWDGTMLRLSSQSEMRECRGNPNFIPTWRATVVRG